MKKRGAGWLALGGVGWWLAACSTSDAPPPPSVEGDGGSAGSSHRGGTSSSAGARDSREGGASGSPGQGGEAVVPLPIGELGGEGLGAPIGGAPAATPSVCDPEASWGDAQGLAGISTSDADERLLAMTYDEQTLVLSRGSSLLVADRTSPSSAFAAPRLLTLPAGYTASRGVALSADGLSLVVAAEDGLGFAELSRASRRGAFDAEPSAARFAAVNDAATFSGGELSSPVLSEDGRSFFYAERRDNRGDVWRASGAELDERVRLDPVIFGSDDGEAKLPLSVSTDLRTLFVLDEALGHVVGLWSATPAAELTLAVPFAGLESAFTNEGCSRLYGTRMLAASLDVVVETPR